MGLFEPTFLRVKVTRGATVCCLIQIVLAIVISVFPLMRGVPKLIEDKLNWHPYKCDFLAENLTILIAVSLFATAILILIGNSKKRYMFFIPALIIQVVNFVLTIGAFFTIGIHYLSGDHARHNKSHTVTSENNSSKDLDIFICLCIALVLQYIFSVFYFKSFEYLRVFRT